MAGADGRARAALIGLGAAARNIYLPALARSGAVELVAGVDPDPAARERVGRLARKIPLFSDLGQLLDSKLAEWALIAAPPAAHRDLCINALRGGLHAFCEKPFVESLEDADAVLEVSSVTGRHVAVNHEFSWMPIFEAARDAIGSGSFGKLLFAQAWETLLERPVAGWRSSGRTMSEFGSHVVDLMVQLHGSLPERVFASMPRVPTSEGADLIDVVALEFPGGRLASIVLDRVCRGVHRYLELRLDGERASLRTSIGGRAGISLFLSPGSWRPRVRIGRALGGQAWLERGDQRVVLARNPANAFACATGRLLESVVSAVHRGEEPPASARYARDIVAVVEAAYESARIGELVHPRIAGRGSQSA